jgi:Flp pilus assembly protein TadG
MVRSSAPRPGAAAVELVFLLPFLALMFAAALDFARAYFATQVLDTAASTGASYASGTALVPASTTTPTAAAVAAAVAEGAGLAPALTADQVTVSISGGVATVTVQYNFPLFTGFLVPGGTVALQRTAVVPVALVTGN